MLIDLIAQATTTQPVAPDSLLQDGASLGVWGVVALLLAKELRPLLVRVLKGTNGKAAPDAPTGPIQSAVGAAIRNAVQGAEEAKLLNELNLKQAIACKTLEDIKDILIANADRGCPPMAEWKELLDRAEKRLT